jgi:YegS/Rv2252/BmrU family lipid kinase
VAAGDRYLLLVNPSAGGGRRAGELLPQVQGALDQHGLEYRWVFTDDLEHGRREALGAAEAGEITLVMSGDGLVGQVGGALAETGATMGIIPGGRGNDLARMLDVPTDPEGAVAVVAGGMTREIDVGVINGKRFLGIASCGFDSDANRIANEARLVRGNLVYAYAALRALVAWKPATFTLTSDGERRQITGYTAAASNSRYYGGGMMAAPEALIDDGLLEVGVGGDVSKLRFLKGIAKIFEGEHEEVLAVQRWRTAEVMIEADRPFVVYADGDPIAELPAAVSLLPRALRMLVPG